MKDSNDASYLIVIDYEDDAERKRAEYLLDNWDDGSVDSLQGLSRIATELNIQELYEDLVTKVPQDRITVQELNEVQTEAAQQKSEFDIQFDTNKEKIEWAIEAIMNKRKTIEKNQEENIYGVYTKKGRGTVKFTISDAPDDQIQLTGEITGFGDAPVFLKQYILDELDYML